MTTPTLPSWNRVAQGAPKPPGPRVFPMRFAAIPERVLLSAVTLIFAAGVCVNVGAFRPWFVLPLALALAVAIVPRVPRLIPEGLRSSQGAAIAVGFTVLWTALNFLWASQYLIVSRDPGFLTLSGMWLTDHPSTDIPSMGAIDAASAQSTYLADASQAWNLKGDVIQPQGAKLLPATLALGGWLAGTTGVLYTNVVIGGLCLLAIYLLSRQIMGPMLALVPMIALSLTLAHIGLSRSAYSEPITLLLVLVSTTLAWKALTHGYLPLLLMAAVLSGMSSWARLDGGIFALGLAVGVAVAIALGAHGHWRRGAVMVAAFTLVQSATLAFGYFAVWWWSQAYVERLWDRAQPLIAGYLVWTVAVLLIAALVMLPISRAVSERVSQPQGARTRAVWGAIAGSAMIAGWVMLASRPLWMVARRFEGDEFHTGVVAQFQEAAGFVVDGSRSYDETTVVWLSYYVGWLTIALGAAGLAMMAYRVFTDSPVWAVPLVSFMAAALLYLWTPSIVPDQLWAIRRLYPAALPAIIIGATLVVQQLRRAGSFTTRTLATGLAIAIALSPVLTWVSFDSRGAHTAVTTIEQGGARAQVEQLCTLADGRPIILVGTSSHFGTLRVACDVPVVLVLGLLEPEDVLTMAEVWGTQPVIVTRHVANVVWAVEPTEPSFESDVTRWGYSLQAAPTATASQHFVWFVADVDDSGLAVPVPQPSALS